MLQQYWNKFLDWFYGRKKDQTFDDELQTAMQVNRDAIIKQSIDQQAFFEYWLLCVMLSSKIEVLFAMFNIYRGTKDFRDDEWLTKTYPIPEKGQEDPHKYAEHFDFVLFQQIACILVTILTGLLRFWFGQKVPRAVYLLLYTLIQIFYLPHYPILPHFYYFAHQMGAPFLMYTMNFVVSTTWYQFGLVFAITIGNYIRILHCYAGYEFSQIQYHMVAPFWVICVILTTILFHLVNRAMQHQIAIKLIYTSKHDEVIDILSHFPSGILLCTKKDKNQIKKEVHDLTAEQLSLDGMDADTRVSRYEFQFANQQFKQLLEQKFIDEPDSPIKFQNASSPNKNQQISATFPPSDQKTDQASIVDNEDVKIDEKEVGGLNLEDPSMTDDKNKLYSNKSLEYHPGLLCQIFARLYFSSDHSPQPQNPTTSQTFSNQHAGALLQNSNQNNYLPIERARFAKKLLSLQDVIEESWLGCRYYRIQKDFLNLPQGQYPTRHSHPDISRTLNTSMHLSAVNAQQTVTIEIQSRIVVFQGKLSHLFIIRNMQQYTQNHENEIKLRVNSMLLSAYNNDIIGPIKQLQSVNKKIQQLMRNQKEQYTLKRAINLQPGTYYKLELGLQQIKNATSKLDLMTQSILDRERFKQKHVVLQKEFKSPKQIESIIRKLFDVYEEQVTLKRLKFQFHRSSHLSGTKIEADWQVYSRTIFHIISNAIRFSNPDGTITVKLALKNAQQNSQSNSNKGAGGIGGGMYSSQSNSVVQVQEREDAEENPHHQPSGTKTVDLQTIIQDNGVGMTKKNLQLIQKEDFRGQINALQKKRVNKSGSSSRNSGYSVKGIGDHSSKNTDILEDFKLGIAISTAQALALAQDGVVHVKSLFGVGTQVEVLIKAKQEAGCGSCSESSSQSEEEREQAIDKTIPPKSAFELLTPDEQKEQEVKIQQENQHLQADKSSDLLPAFLNNNYTSSRSPTNSRSRSSNSSQISQKRKEQPENKQRKLLERFYNTDLSHDSEGQRPFFDKLEPCDNPCPTLLAIDSCKVELEIIQAQIQMNTSLFVDTCTSGEEAILLIKKRMYKNCSCPSGYNIVFIGDNLPGINIFKLCDKLNKMSEKFRQENSPLIVESDRDGENNNNSITNKNEGRDDIISRSHQSENYSETERVDRSVRMRQQKTQWNYNMTLVALTSHLDDNFVNKSQQVGFDAILVKPMTQRNLHDLLEQYYKQPYTINHDNENEGE